MIINDGYVVRCDEGVVAYGEPVVTRVKYTIRRVMLPLAFKRSGSEMKLIFVS